jgi:2-polyprenyl-3-methyl-5-hydroxy-6-metoxy-1,4-benzoquinol methylase
MWLSTRGRGCSLFREHESNAAVTAFRPPADRDTVLPVSTTNIPAVAGEWPAEGLEQVERCPACASSKRSTLYDDLTDRSYRSAPGRWRLFRCETCSCAYLDPRPDRRTAPLAYSTYYDSEPESREDGDRVGWRRLRRALRNDYLNSKYGYRLTPAASAGRFLVPLLPSHREMADEHVRHLHLPAGRPQLLDVGCGEGAFLAEMQSLGWSVHGLEPTAEAVASAQARGVPVTRGTLSEESLDDGSFDAITFRLVFEHLGDPLTTLTACRRALKVGGVLWIETPSLESRGHRTFGRDWIHLEPPRHAVVYTASALTRLLTRVGFETLAVKPVRHARWSFRMSAALAHGLPPFENAPRLSRSWALRAVRANLEALVRPVAADVIVVVARAA